jgi:hypothetical protein
MRIGRPTSPSDTNTAPRTVERVAVSNATLRAFTARHAQELEAVVPAGKGHIYFRLGERVYDFGPDGFRAGPVRPIGSDRYGFALKLPSAALRALADHCRRLERTDGEELGAYDFDGSAGFHCVTWIAHLPLGPLGETLVDFLGGADEDIESMPAFAAFLVARAPVERLAIYSQQDRTPLELERLALDIISEEALLRQHRP